MTKRYIAAPGRAIPGGWPESGRPINELSRLHRNYVRDGDLIEAPERKADPAPGDGDPKPATSKSRT